MLWLLAQLRGPFGLLAILPLGALVTWSRARTDSRRLGIALHIAWNAVAVFMPVLARLQPG